MQQQRLSSRAAGALQLLHILTETQIRHSCTPPEQRLQHQLTVHWHLHLCGRVAKNVLTPEKAVTLRDQSMR